jgi:hypothetical protein
LRRATTAVGLFLLLFTLTSGIAWSLTDVEWTDSVDAAEAVDPTLVEPPLTGTDVSVVGGGNSGNTNFALSAFRRDGEVRGRISVTDRMGNHFSANVVCIDAVVAPDGSGGAARLVGELIRPTGNDRTLFVDAFDSDFDGGTGDLFNWSATPNEVPCAPPVPAQAITHGNIAVRSLD